MANESVYLPPFATRGANMPKSMKGWRIVNPNQTRTFKATRMATFKSPTGETYAVFRMLLPKRGSIEWESEE